MNEEHRRSQRQSKQHLPIDSDPLHQHLPAALEGEHSRHEHEHQQWNCLAGLRNRAFRHIGHQIQGVKRNGRHQIAESDQRQEHERGDESHYCREVALREYVSDHIAGLRKHPADHIYRVACAIGAEILRVEILSARKRRLDHPQNQHEPSDPDPEKRPAQLLPPFNDHQRTIGRDHQS